VFGCCISGCWMGDDEKVAKADRWRLYGSLSDIRRGAVDTAFCDRNCSSLFDGGDVPDCGVRVGETIMGRRANASWTPIVVADLNSRTLSLSNSGVSETQSIWGLLAPTFVMLSDVVDRHCHRHGFCFVLYKVKAYPCVQRDVLDDIHQISERIGSNKNRPRTDKEACESRYLQTLVESTESLQTSCYPTQPR
jgi:hypothetical protein